MADQKKKGKKVTPNSLLLVLESINEKLEKVVNILESNTEGDKKTKGVKKLLELDDDEEEEDDGRIKYILELDEDPPQYYGGMLSTEFGAFSGKPKSHSIHFVGTIAEAVKFDDRAAAGHALELIQEAIADPPDLVIGEVGWEKERKGWVQFV